MTLRANNVAPYNGVVIPLEVTYKGGAMHIHLLRTCDHELGHLSYSPGGPHKTNKCNVTSPGPCHPGHLETDGTGEDVLGTYFKETVAVVGHVHEATKNSLALVIPKHSHLDTGKTGNSNGVSLAVPDPGTPHKCETKDREGVGRLAGTYVSNSGLKTKHSILKEVSFVTAKAGGVVDPFPVLTYRPIPIVDSGHRSLFDDA